MTLANQYLSRLVTIFKLLDATTAEATAAMGHLGIKLSGKKVTEADVLCCQSQIKPVVTHSQQDFYSSVLHAVRTNLKNMKDLRNA